MARSLNFFPKGKFMEGKCMDGCWTRWLCTVSGLRSSISLNTSCKGEVVGEDSLPCSPTAAFSGDYW